MLRLLRQSEADEAISDEEDVAERASESDGRDEEEDDDAHSASVRRSVPRVPPCYSTQFECIAQPCRGPMWIWVTCAAGRLTRGG